MSDIQILQRFREGYLGFIDSLISQFPREPNLIVGRVFFEDGVPVELVAKNFIQRILPYKDQIARRDDSFFMENNHIFGMVSEKNTKDVVHFKTLWASNQLDDEDRNTIWEWFDLFCKLMEKYSNIVNRK